MLETIELETQDTVDSAVIWLHGLGADGHDFESVVDELDLPHGVGIRFVFPHAPIRPVTINGGMRMRAWYDISHQNLGQGVDLPGVAQSAREVGELLQREIKRGIAPERLILAGFSQGGLIALHLGTRFPERLGGIMALSTYDPTAADLPVTEKPIPIFQGHGSYDPVVPLALAEQALESLRKAGYAPEFHRYSMPHSLCGEELRDISLWLSSRLGG